MRQSSKVWTAAMAPSLPLWRSRRVRKIYRRFSVEVLKRRSGRLRRMPRGIWGVKTNWRCALVADGGDDPIGALEDAALVTGEAEVAASGSAI